MKRIWRSLLGLVLLFVLGFAGYAWRHHWSKVPSRPTPAIDLAAPIMSYEEYGTFEHPRPYVIEIDSAPGKLLYMGIGHTRDPRDPQIALIRERWATFKPTVALLESRLGLYVGPFDAGVREFGEAGAVYALAKRDGVPLWSLEPPIEDEVRFMLQKWSPQHVALFYTLRTYMGDRKTDNGDPDALLAGLLEKRKRYPGLEKSFRDLADLDAFYKRTFPNLPDWRKLPDEAMWPGREDSDLNHLATRSNQFRDEHIARLLVDLVRRGERVFAAVGASHAVMEERALRETLRPNNSAGLRDKLSS
jgi:hypothetical protein